MTQARFEDLARWARQEMEKAQNLPPDERARHTTRTIYRFLENVTWLESYQMVTLRDVQSELIAIKSLWRKSQSDETRAYFLEPIHPLAGDEKEEAGE
jgi:hypothetical protein